MLDLAISALSSLLTVVALAGEPQQPPIPPPSAFEGRWLGTAGFASDRTAYGLELRRNASGELEALLCSPVVHFYAMPAGNAVVDGDRCKIEELGLELVLANDALEGSFSVLKVPVSMQRVDELPNETPIPPVASGPGPRARVKLGAPIWGGVAARDGIAYAGTAGGVMNAVNVRDGSFAWTFNAGAPLFGEPLATSDALYFTCDDGRLYKLDRASGREVWRYELDDGRTPRVLPHPAVYEYDHSAPRPVLVDGMLFVGAGDGGVHAVRESDGTRVWRVATGDRVRTDALVHGERVYFGSLDGHLYALDRTNGTLAWKKNLFGALTSSPALVGDDVVIGNRGAMLYALKPDDGAVRWRAIYWGSWVESTAVAHADRMYVGSSDLRRVACYDPKDGVLVWRTDVYGCPWARPLVTADVVYACVVGSEPYPIRHEGSVCALDRASGALKWRWPAPIAPGSFQNGFTGAPALDGSSLVAGALDGTLYVFALE